MKFGKLKILPKFVWILHGGNVALQLPCTFGETPAGAPALNSIMPSASMILLTIT